MQAITSIGVLEYLVYHPERVSRSYVDISHHTEG
jgi:hypothetical protein